MAFIDVLRNELKTMRLAPSTLIQQLEASLREESEAERLRDRAAQAAERASIEREQMERARAHVPRRAAADKAIREKQAALDRAMADAYALVAEERAIVLELGRRHDRISVALTASASSQIEAFVRELGETWTATYALRDDVSERTIDGGFCVTWSNATSIARRTEAIRATIETANALVFEPLDEKALKARIEALRAGLPDIDARPAKYLPTVFADA